MFIWLCDCRQIHLPLPWSQCRTATGTHFKRAGVTLTGLQACVRLFPSPQIKCCFSRLAVAQSPSVCNVCICLYMGVSSFFYEWVEDGLRDQFATRFDHCKYEFRLFLYRELEWSLILRELDTNFRHLGGIWGITERGWWFFICSEKAAFTGSLVKSTSHWLSGWFDTRLFFCGIQQ